MKLALNCEKYLYINVLFFGTVCRLLSRVSLFFLCGCGSRLSHSDVRRTRGRGRDPKFPQQRVEGYVRIHSPEPSKSPSRNQGESALDALPFRGRRGGALPSTGKYIDGYMNVQHRIPLGNSGY